MPIEILHGSLEERVVRYLLEVYPATVEDLERELKVKRERVERILRSLAQRGAIELEPLPDKTFIRLIRSDFHFTGIKPTQRRRFKQSGGKKQASKDYEGPMYA